MGKVSSVTVLRFRPGVDHGSDQAALGEVSQETNAWPLYLGFWFHGKSFQLTAGVTCFKTLTINGWLDGCLIKSWMLIKLPPPFLVFCGSYFLDVFVFC